MFVIITVLILVSSGFFWLFAEHLVERYMDGDWGVFWHDWQTIFIVFVSACSVGFGFLKLMVDFLKWAAGL